MSSSLESRAIDLHAQLTAMREAQDSPFIANPLIEATAFMAEAITHTQAGDYDGAMDLIQEARDVTAGLGSEYQSGMVEKLERLWHAYLNWT